MKQKSVKIKQKFNCLAHKFNMKAKELGRILLAMGDVPVVIASSFKDSQIQLKDVKSIRLEDNIVTLM